MKIILISYYFDEDASGIISGRVARELVRQGVEVHVVTSNLIDTHKSRPFQIHHVPDFFHDRNLFIRTWKIVLNLFGIGTFQQHLIWRKKAAACILKLLKREHFDWLYCRSTPFDANHVGYIVSKNSNVKVLQHFTDPYPPEGDFLQKNVSRDKLIRKAKTIIQAADLVSFGNEAMMNYEKKETNVDFSRKCFVSNDIASSCTIKFVPPKESPQYRIVYLGTLYPPRNPNPLVNAISELYKRNLIFRIYSAKPVISSLIEPFVQYMGRTSDILLALSDADILVDIDGDSENPVYISSKLKDYLLINRPILSITPRNSPSAKILSNLRTVRVVENKKDQILDALNYLTTAHFRDDDYYERTPVIQLFSPEKVVKEIVDKMIQYIKI